MVLGIVLGINYLLLLYYDNMRAIEFFFRDLGS